MADRVRHPSYAIVSPVKDEERYIELTLQSVTAQTVKPLAWVIVDDGSTDATPDIVRRYAADHRFISLVPHPRAGVRQPGAAVIHAFNYGYATLVGLDHDHIVKLDCDLSFAPDYFERLLDGFAVESRLGIASGVYMEPTPSGAWKRIAMPAYHAFGASKMLRRRCFEDIGGFVAAPGWDTVDEIRALARGWTTRHFGALEVRHHKPEGSGIGRLKTSRMHGEIYYTTGGDPLFFMLKVLRRVGTPPVLTNALALLIGYLSAMLRKQPRLVTPAEARSYRRLLRRRVFQLKLATS